MKRTYLLLFLAFAFVFSCTVESTDDTDLDPNMEQGSDDDSEDGSDEDDSSDDSDDADNEDDDAQDGEEGENDDEDGVVSYDNLIGEWLLSDLRFDETLNDDQLNFAKQILEYLTENECNLITMTFDDDGTSVSNSKMNHLSINVGVGGLEIPCPAESDEESTTWSLEDDQLTLTDEEMEERTITIVMEGDNTLIIDGAEVDENNYDGAEAVFTRVEEEVEE
ncbi:lipocalin family protein [Flagellimonas myxillae]|uniref:lipocalin family protein n=1 Tax=Flagellimonas myxillae TaxID=2942214 RepID=UPI00201F6734|nr:lipocalin family protein [Muricauda myxillae]MCL6267265.1 lipocalin family protein [Muricauda myxillae]